MDVRVAQAREHNAQAGILDGQAARHRLMRDRIIRELHEEDPGTYSYGQLAKLLGVSKELVAYICHGRQKKTR